MSPSKSKQRGNALLILGLLMAMAAATAITQFLVSRAAGKQGEQYNAKVLAQAKNALIAFAVASRNAPGQLPCPDRTGDGFQDSCGNAAGTTGQNFRIGRLPWKDLGIEELKDSEGQVLWYAVSNNFKSITAVYPLNSNSTGTILIKNSAEQTIQNPASGTGAIAIIMAAGSNGPDRFVSAAVTEDNSNFIDGSTSNGFIQGPIRNAKGTVVVNDQIEFISYEDLLPLVEKRVAGDVLQATLGFNRFYGTAAARPAGFGDPSCLNLSAAFITCPSSNADCSNPVFSSTPRTISFNCTNSSTPNTLCNNISQFPNRIEIVCNAGSATSLACETGNCESLTLAKISPFCNSPSGVFTIHPCSSTTYSAGASPINCGRVPENFGGLNSSPTWATAAAAANTIDPSVISPPPANQPRNWFHLNQWRELTLIAYPPGMIANSTGCGTGNATTLDVRTHRANEPNQAVPGTSLAPTTNAVVANTPIVIVAGRKVGAQTRQNQYLFDQYFERPLVSTLPNPVYQQANPYGPIWWTGKTIANTFNDTISWSAP